MTYQPPEGLSYARLVEKRDARLGEDRSDLGLRIHRALSWLRRAEGERDDSDAAFIFYWIAFNAAYAADVDAEPQAPQPPAGRRDPERRKFDEYFRKLIDLDRNRLIYDALWERFSGSIRVLMENQYVFQPFWDYHNRAPGHDAHWETQFDSSRSRIRGALARRDTRLVLNTLFARLYVLRNQLVHGGATWNSSVNRHQVSDGARIMAFLVPVFIDLMMEHPEIDWGPPYYPVVSPR